MAESVSVGVRKLRPEAFDPVYTTEGSSCFDLRACFPEGSRQVRAYSGINNAESVISAVAEYEKDTVHIKIPPRDRVVIPTQLAFSIPDGWSLRLHMKSGLAVKGGLILSSGEGIIDSDYTDQLYIAITNTSTMPVRINHGDCVCQAELVSLTRASFKTHR
jgi:deoxyuridine 5'-triphosphate nucleotidohydrolase